MLRANRECSAVLVELLYFQQHARGRPWLRRWDGSRTATCAEPISSGGGEVDLLGALGSRSPVPKIQEHLRNFLKPRFRRGEWADKVITE
jgi:hypothetical protein